MIIGEKTRLRAIERSDIPAFVRWFNDPEVRSYLTTYSPLSQAEEERWFKKQLDDEDRHNLAIETSEGVHIGVLGFHEIDWKNRLEEPLCWVWDRHWREGFLESGLRH